MRNCLFFSKKNWRKKGRRSGEEKKGKNALFDHLALHVALAPRQCPVHVNLDVERNDFADYTYVARHPSLFGATADHHGHPRAMDRPRIANRYLHVARRLG